MVVALRGFVMKAWLHFSQLTYGAWSLITCSAVLFICISSFCTRKQIHRRAPPCERLMLAFFAVAVLLQLLSTVGAAKSRPFRYATSNVWAEGKPSARYHLAMAAGPDDSLYGFGGNKKDFNNMIEKLNDLFKLDPDTKEWHIIEPQGSVKPSWRSNLDMVTVGSDLYVFGGRTVESESNELFRFLTTEQKWEQLDAPRVSGSPPNARRDHGMVAVGSDLYVFGGCNDKQGEENRCAAGRRLGACQIQRVHCSV